jgi:hypothetical protein
MGWVAQAAQTAQPLLSQHHLRETVLDPRAALITDIDMQLRHYLGQGVDQQRSLVDARYARDVLLVCDGMTGTDLPVLSKQFRQASQGVRIALPVLRAAVVTEPEPRSAAGQQTIDDTSAAAGHDAGPPQGWAQNTSGFGHSHPAIADFNLAPRYGTRDSALVATDRQGHLIPPPGIAASYSPHTALPWYSWRRWWVTKQA